MTPYYVKIKQSGPNNTSHKRHNRNKIARYKEGNQVFKIVEVDGPETAGRLSPTLITEDGYILWNGCVRVATEEEYNKERNMEPLVFS